MSVERDERALEAGEMAKVVKDVAAAGVLDPFAEWGVRVTEAVIEELEVYNSFARLVRDENEQLYLLGFCDGILPDEGYSPEEGYLRLDLALPLSTERLQLLESGEMDLRTAYIEPEGTELAMCVLWPSGKVNLNFFPAADVFFQYLPGRVKLTRRDSTRTKGKKVEADSNTATDDNDCRGDDS